MPITLRPNDVNYKDGNSYKTMNVIADQKTSEKIAAIEAAASAEVTKITEKGTETRNSIPDNYTALSDQVVGLKGDISQVSESITEIQNEMFDGRLLLDFENGYVGSNGINGTTNATQVRMKEVKSFPFDVNVKSETGFNMQLFTFSDASMSNPTSVWIGGGTDGRTIPKGTFFKVMSAFATNLVEPEKSVEIAKPITERQAYNAVTVTVPNKINKELKDITDEIEANKSEIASNKSLITGNASQISALKTTLNEKSVQIDTLRNDIGGYIYTRAYASATTSPMVNRTEDILEGERFSVNAINSGNNEHVSRVYIYGMYKDESGTDQHDTYYPNNQEAEIGTFYTFVAKRAYRQIRIAYSLASGYGVTEAKAIIIYTDRDTLSANIASLLDKAKYIDVMYKKPMSDIYKNGRNIVLLGDSIVWGVGSSDFWVRDASQGLIPNSVKEGYPDGMYRNSGTKAWAKKFIAYMTANYQNVTITNNGIGGDKWTDLATKITTMIPSGCNTAIICMGINDKNNIGAIHDAVVTVIDFLRNHNIDTYVITPYNCTAQVLPKNASMIGSAVKDVCAELHQPVYDLYAESEYYRWVKGIELSETLANDGLHPNDVGHEIIYNCVRKLLGM